MSTAPGSDTVVMITREKLEELIFDAVGQAAQTAVRHGGLMMWEAQDIVNAAMGDIPVIMDFTKG